MATKSNVMRRAWEIFRTSYNFPAIPFRSIGRMCFAWALRKAWAEIREAAEVAATTTEALARLAANYAEQLDGFRYRDWGSNVEQAKATIRTALRPIEAELARRAGAEPASA